MRDLDLVAGKHLTYELPPEKKYLLRYFTTPTQKEFVKYFLVYGVADNFSDHTGLACTDRWVRKMRQNLQNIMAAHQEAKKKFDLTTVVAIEEGKFKLGDKSCES